MSAGSAELAPQATVEDDRAVLDEKASSSVGSTTSSRTTWSA